VTCPVEVVPDAIDTTFWSQRPEQPPEDRFTVVSWGKMSSRKMPIELLQVFSTAFPHDRYPECRLEIKTHGGILGGGAHLIPSIADPRVTIHDDVWSTDELRSWVARAHCAACLSRGEGMYLPPLQAMALGVPTVVVDHTGPHDFADERWNWPVRLDEREPLVPSPMGGGMRWWNPDLEHAVAQLRAVYDDYARARERAKHGRRLVLRRYNPQAVVDRFLDALKVLA
jgi:glycosyltransferase involved in cell wall biosynthesis